MTNGTDFSGLVLFSLGTNFAPRFKMADFPVLLFVFEIAGHFEMLNEILEDNNDIAIFSAVSCFIWRDLNRIQGYFEVNVPSKLGGISCGKKCVYI